LSRITRDNKLSYGGNLKSLSQLVLKQYQVLTDRQTDEQTDEQTDRITIANTHCS